MSKNLKIVVGLSGGVDSSVAALLLKNQGHEVIGVFMQNWEADKDDPFCSAEQDLTDARSVADKLNIPLKTVNFAKEYWDRVFQHFLDEYSAGRTPNPDILCNKEIKFKAFLDYALSLGADAIATGHYVRKSYSHGEYQLLKGLDPEKDQSYFLYTLKQKQLKYALFPIGDLHKTDVRKIAEKSGFINHNKKDSTGICFIGERRFNEFLKEYLLAKPGDIKTTDGEIIAKHQGLMYYTLGQRQGLGIGGLHHYPEMPWYVVDKDIQNNALIVAQEHDHPCLMKDHLMCSSIDWVSERLANFPLQCTAKIRYRHKDVPCVVSQNNDGNLVVRFDDPQRAVTPGQSVVFYSGDVCLGGGVILNWEANITS